MDRICWWFCASTRSVVCGQTLANSLDISHPITTMRSNVDELHIDINDIIYKWHTYSNIFDTSYLTHHNYHRRFCIFFLSSRSVFIQRGSPASCIPVLVFFCRPRKRACFYMCHLVFSMLLGPKLTVDHSHSICGTLVKPSPPHWSTLHIANLSQSCRFCLELRLGYQMQAYNSSWLVRLQTRNVPRQPSWKPQKPPRNATQLWMGK